MADFWSHRRAAVAAEDAAEVRASEAAAEGERNAALEERDDEEILAELNLKAPEEMRPGDDFSAFMKAAVPDRLRRRALRVLWRSNPMLANLDSLVDYGEDFTDGATIMANMQTTYQVGKGMLRHVTSMAEAAEADAAAPPAEPGEAEADAPALAETEETEGLPETGAEPQETAADAPPEPETATDEAPPSAPRRIRFDFA
ncbi:DUF3306 domain-containing protein [Maritimibacter sp. 55A14]|uniref:DUF3306 domain-containing protein n=1 Tax=Maritimibacter sp. 55A14 TaxID=2174844 RepID=UPI000D61BBA5|nr:DUF3306 domain-containing protein [Maritimibacter sp. 55A14]PWE32574.1 DUF3306 domain-containing protein [Maritimibacter sp. 55A14]